MRDFPRYRNVLEQIEAAELEKERIEKEKDTGMCVICKGQFSKSSQMIGKHCRSCHEKCVLPKKLGDRAKYVHQESVSNRCTVESILNKHDEIVGEDPESLSTDFMLKLIYLDDVDE